MYICVCNALKEREIRSAAAEAGVTSAAGFFERKCIRPVCGKCVPDLHRMVREVGAPTQAPPVPGLKFGR